MKSGIYRIYSIATGESYYGSTRNFSLRFNEHRYKFRNNNGNHKMRALLKQYGAENFKFEILEYCLPDQFEEIELKYILSDEKRLNVWILPFAAKGANYGNNVKRKQFYIGTPHTEESKKKLSISVKAYFDKNGSPLKGKPKSEEHIKKMSEGQKLYFSKNISPLKGKPRTDEVKNKISQSNKIYFSNNGSVWTGRKHGEETKNRMSKVKKENPMSEESRKMMIDKLKAHYAKNGHPCQGKSLSEETKLKISNTLKNRGVI